MKKYFLFFIFSFLSNILFAQERYGQLKGRILDEVSKKPIVKATVHVAETGKDYFPDENGFFVVDSLLFGEYHLAIASSGHELKICPVVIGKAENEEDFILLRMTIVCTWSYRWIYFEKNSSEEISEESAKELLKLCDFMKENPAIMLELGGIPIFLKLKKMTLYFRLKELS